MDSLIMAMQRLSNLLKQPILMTILPREDDPADGVFQPVQVSPWCSACERHHD